jgi:hypothetical protein
MARKPKIGLDYFPLDRDFYHDLKVRRILKSCGPASGTVLTCLLGNIYYEKGYYIQWDEDLTFDIADKLGMSEGSVQEIINIALKVKFFNEDLFSKYKILTSRGIQTRYMEILSQLRRSSSHIKKEYLIPEKDVDNSNPHGPEQNSEKAPTPNNFGKNGINAEEKPIISEKTPNNSAKKQQTKGKETKGKETIAKTDIDSTEINKFVNGFKKRFGVQFSRDNVASLQQYLIKNSYAIAVDYYNSEIFLRTLLRRMEDKVAEKKEQGETIANPISYFFSGINAKDKTKRFLLKLTKIEEDAGSGYHKPMMRAVESGKSPIAGLKTM